MTFPQTQTPPPIPTTINVTRFFGIEARLHALHWCGEIQIAIWAAGANSGYGLKLHTERSPSLRFPHLALRVCRSAHTGALAQQSELG